MSPVKDFVHLHVHSDFSLLDGAVTIKKLAQAAMECGMPALALTDHGNLFGAIQFYRQCKATRIGKDRTLKPIIGMEAYIAPRSRLEKKRTSDGAFYHLVLLARNEEGYQNLMRLSSLAYTEGFYYRPRIDKEILGRYAKGLVGMSACLSSEINRAAIYGNEAELRQQIETYRSLFEPGCFFLELQRNGLQEQERVLEKIPPLAKEYGIPLVATNDIHYLRRDDAHAQEVHLCINTGQTMDDSDRMRFKSDQFFFRTQEEMAQNLGDFPEALEHTVAIAEMCDLELDFSKTYLPPFEIPGGEDAEAFFRRLCEEGCRERYADFDHKSDIQKRLDYEISVIRETGYISYFLIVWDFIRFSRESHVPVGPGRGSAAGSLVAYALKITNVDPLKYDLLFERFLNAERHSMPDIDIDFCMEGRERVIDYVRRKYGNDRVSQIITFGTMAARAVLRDVGRSLNVPLSEVDAIAKKIPAGPGVALEKSLEQDSDLKKLRVKDKRIRELFDISLRLEGLNRHCSTHAAGVVIGNAPLIDTVPLYRNGEDITTQWTMEDLERVGMLKMDFLGLRTLTIIDRAVKEIQRCRGVTLDMDAVPLDDEKTYDLLCRGDTVAVFQLESKGMRDLLRRLKPDRFEDIIAVLALYRPGPLEGGMVDKYVHRKHGEEPIEYPHPTLEPILRETNGVILYQEQVMRIANVLAGFTLVEADLLRKAMGKKKKELMEGFKEKFISGAEKNGVERKLASHIFDLIEFFAGYGFNKSHSTAYALISYQTAYLKANYPMEFMAAVMTCEMSNTDKVVDDLEETRRMGIKIMPPSVNRSQKGFSVNEGKIWYGLEAIKGLGGKVVDQYLREREQGGEFRSIFEFCERLDGHAVNRSALESLVSCGAFDSFGQRRSQLMAAVETAIVRGNEARKDRKAGQLSLFSLFGEGNEGDDASRRPAVQDAAGPNGMESYPDIPEWSDSERLSREKQSLGFYLSGHPLDTWQTVIKKFANHTVSEISTLADGKHVVLGAQITKLTKKVSKRSGNPFWVMQVEDLGSSMEVFVNHEQFDASQGCIEEERLVCLKGTVRYRDTTATLRLDAVFPLEEAPQRLSTDLSVIISLDGGGNVEDLIFRLKKVLTGHQGKCPVFLVFKKTSGEHAILQVGRQHFVALDIDAFHELEALCGHDNLLFNRMSNRSA